ncbi:MAG: sulfatase-like hydrolase/transferase [Bacteroidales bacterium]|nr:sulfatase-like hydrolase/transferase [Bacteroidales bacterium]
MTKHHTRHLSSLSPRPIVCLVAGSVAAGATAQQKATPERPNIVFILADDMGYGDLSCYGNKYIQTPNIDRLAETGTRFEQAYAGSGISSPSRCCLMTGRNSGNSRIRDNQCYEGGMVGVKINPKGDTTYVRRANLLPEDTTIATVLSAAHYRTCLVNKWHLDGYDPGSAPNHRGFDEFYGWTISTVHSNAPYYYPYYRFHGDSLINIRENSDDAHVRHNTEISTDDAIAFIHRNKNNPFFLYLAYDCPHEPYIIDNVSWYDGQEDWPVDVKRYASLITHMDAQIGRVLGALDNLGLRENTLVIFASDNGVAVMAPREQLGSGAGLKGRKGQLYEGGIKVPLIVNQPGRVPVRSVENLIYFPDFMPTLAAIAGAKDHLPQVLDGMDISPLFYGKNVDTDSRPLYWEFPGKQRALRLGDWKCVTVKKGAPLELYNISKDKTESNNLADKYPKKVKEMDRIMRRMHKPSPNYPIPEDNEKID